MKPALVTAIVLFVAFGCGRDQTVAERQRDALPHAAAQHLIEANRAFDRGVYEAALALSDSVEKYAPDLADLHFLRGAIYTQLNQLEISQAAYERVLEIDAGYRGARFNMGLNNFRRGKLRDAIDLYTAEASEIGSTTALYQELGRAYQKLGVPDSAQAAYEAALDIDPAYTTAYMWLGQLLEETGDLEGALAASLKGLALRPDDLDYQYIVGTQYFRLDDAVAALSYLEPVAKARAWHHGAQFNLGQVYMRLGREQEAQTYFARADSAQQLQQSINEAQDAINHDPESLDNWINLGRLLRQSGQYDRAIEAYKVALVIMPWNLELQNNLGILEMESGNLEVAIGRFEAILREDPSMDAVRLNLGVAYANSGDSVMARFVWEDLLKRSPGHAVAQAFLSQLESD